MDYLRVSNACAVFRAFPNLGWVDVSAASPGYVAAPALALQHVLGAPMHFDWGTAAADAALRQSELLVMISLGAMGRFADTQEGLGVLGRAYTSTKAHLDALEVALPRCPAPSPFLLGVGDLVAPSAFLAAAVPPVLAVIGAAAVPAVVGVPAVLATGPRCLRGPRCQALLLSPRCAPAGLVWGKPPWPPWLRSLRLWLVLRSLSCPLSSPCPLSRQ